MLVVVVIVCVLLVSVLVMFFVIVIIVVYVGLTQAVFLLFYKLIRTTNHFRVFFV